MSVLRFLRNTAKDLCFGCHHDHLTRPFTIARPGYKETYLVCLDCGHQLAYSAEAMRPLSRREARRLRHQQRQAATITLVPALPQVEETHIAA